MSKYNIQVASNLSGVGTHTLRAWEKRYKAIVPDRSDSGRRLYSDDDIEKLQLLSELCTLGNSIGAIANKPKDELKEILKKLGKKNFSSPQSLNLEENPLRAKEALTSLLFALEHFKLDILSHEIGKLKITLSSRDFSLNILSPLLEQLNEKVANGSISIAHKTALCSIIKFHVGHIVFKSYEQKSKNPNKIAIATINEDEDELFSMFSSLLCAHYNVNFFYLGQSIPANTLAQASNSLEANIILINFNSEVSAEITNLKNNLEKLASSVRDEQQIYVVSNFQLISNHASKIMYFKDLKELDKHLKTIA
jgi:DNA-binding transcriptional MerR regulator